jgi:glycolate oxidase iron-sulfur subunit
MTEGSVTTSCPAQPDVVGMAAHAKRTSAFEGIDIPSYADIVNCIHCGICFPHCPTYALTGLEKDSPRGRIRLIKEIADGRLEISLSVAEALDVCLLCRACETACPADVKYGQLAEAARVQIERSGILGGLTRRLLREVFFRQVFTRPWALRLLGRATRLYQRALRPVLYATRAVYLMPKRLRQVEPLAPPIPDRFGYQMIPETSPAFGERKYRVGVLSGCVMDIAFADVNYDTVSVLRHNGCEVVMPRDQVCCGSLHAHNGDMETARRLAKRNIEVFERAGVDSIVVNSAGCGVWMMEYGDALAHEPEWAERAKAFSAKVVDVSKFLVQNGMKEPGKEIRHQATYDDACHLLHGQGVSAEPRELLARIPGLELVELNEASWCCGSAGIYNLTNTEQSMMILDRKMENIRQTGADLIITGNPGCLVQLRYGVKRHGLEARVLHPITLLREAYDLPPSPSSPGE